MRVPELLSEALSLLSEARALPIGTRRVHGGRPVVKTRDGWEDVPSAPDHAGPGGYCRCGAFVPGTMARECPDCGSWSEPEDRGDMRESR